MSTDDWDEPPPRPIRVVVFPTDPDERVAVQTMVTSELGIYEALGGGSPEYVFLPSLGSMLLVDDYGKSKRLPANPRATRFVDSQIRGFARADMIMGLAVLVGRDGGGWTTDVSPEAEEAALAEQRQRDRLAESSAPGLRLVEPADGTDD